MEAKYLKPRTGPVGCSYLIFDALSPTHHCGSSCMQVIARAGTTGEIVVQPRRSLVVPERTDERDDRAKSPHVLMGRSRGVPAIE